MADEYNPFARFGLGEGTPTYGPSPTSSPFGKRDTDPGIIGGVINSLFGSRESRYPEFAQMAREERQAAAAAEVYRELSIRVQEKGMTPQAALVDYIKSPQGADRFAMDAGSLMKGVQSFVQGISPEAKTLPPGNTLVERNPLDGTVTPKFQASDPVGVPIKDQYHEQVGIAVIDRTSGMVISSTRPDLAPPGRPFPGFTPGQQPAAPGAPGTTGQPPAPPPVPKAQGPVDIERAKAAIASIETPGSANPYAERNAKSGAIGKYQVMPANVPSWTEEAGLGRMTPEQFAASPEAQERVFEHRFPLLVQQFGSPERAALVWFSGPRGTLMSKDANNTTGQRYMERFSKVYNAGQPVQAQAQTPGAPGATVTPPGVKGTTMIPTRVQAPAGPQQDSGFKPLWQQIPLSTGAITGALSIGQRVTGQFGVDILPKEVSQARLAFKDASTSLIRATALNPRFIGAEQERILKEFSFEPGFFVDERTLADRLIYMDNNATNWINQLNKEWVDPRTPMERKKEIANAIQSFRHFKERLGVPPEGSPERENPPRSTFREQLDMGKKAVGAVREGSGRVKREAVGAEKKDLPSMSLDELRSQPGITPDQKRRLDALRQRGQ